MIRQILLILCGMMMIGLAKAQDPVFSQYYSAPLQLNPAFAGNSYAPSFSLNYRNQWPQLGAYTTYAASFDHFIQHLNSGIGIMVQTDDAGQGLIKTNKISGVFAYRLQIVKGLYAKIGAEVSWVQGRYNWNVFEFGDQIDPILGKTSAGGTPFPTEEDRPDDFNNTYGDIGAGMLIYNKTFYGGFSIKHINRPNESLLGVNENLIGGLPYRFSVHGGAQIQLRKGNKRRPVAFISPNVMLVRQADFGQINAGAYLGYGKVFAGAWYRHAWSNADAFIGLVGVEHDIFKIGYSYDLTVSKLNNTGGSHEISIRIQLKEPGQDINDCFQLFR